VCITNPIIQTWPHTVPENNAVPNNNGGQNNAALEEVVNQCPLIPRIANLVFFVDFEFTTLNKNKISRVCITNPIIQTWPHTVPENNAAPNNAALEEAVDNYVILMGVSIGALVRNSGCSARCSLLGNCI
jgi:hypothetical protein